MQWLEQRSEFPAKGMTKIIVSVQKTCTDA